MHRRRNNAQDNRRKLATTEKQTLFQCMTYKKRAGWRTSPRKTVEGKSHLRVKGKVICAVISLSIRYPVVSVHYPKILWQQIPGMVLYHTTSGIGACAHPVRHQESGVQRSSKRKIQPVGDFAPVRQPDPHN